MKESEAKTEASRYERHITDAFYIYWTPGSPDEILPASPHIARKVT
jgi:hypothetical protein